MKNRKRELQAAVIIFLLWPVMGCQAAARVYDPYPVVSLEIVSDERGRLPRYDAGFGNESSRRSYVEARDGERYRIRVGNRSGRRVGLVIAVDGRNIISGGQSNLGPQERMYILEPYQWGEYEGWRTGWNQVNRFYFRGMSDSYAAAWGDYTAMGVIAVAVYRGREEERFPPRKFQQKKGPMARGQREAPGTGYGEPGWSPSRPVLFYPEELPALREFIKYEWRTNLCKRGLLDCRWPHGENRFWPGPFDGGGFVPPPPGWPFLGR